MMLVGRVCSGGNYDEQYFRENQFTADLGYVPYPGTLNVEFEEPLPCLAVTEITVGRYKAVQITVGGYRGHIVYGKKGSFGGRQLCGVVSETYLRDKLNLEDGDIVELEVLE